MLLNKKAAKFATVFFAANLAIGAAAASAGEVRFGYKASELTTPTGAQDLYERINDHAHRSCGVDNAKAIHAKRAAKACAENLTNDFVDLIDDARLNRAQAAADQDTRVASRS